MTTKTRYVSYVSDYFSAAAGTFYFGSNYLAPTEDGVQYTISSWNKQNFSVTIQIQNFENSLQYNGAGTDFYYVVEGAMYKDAECTEKSQGFEVYVTHSAETVTIDDVTYAYMAGTESFNKSAGSNNVTVMAETSGIASGTQYFKIRAYTVPVLPETEEIIHPHTEGVFHSQVEAVFVLADSAGSVDVSSVLKQSHTNAEVQLRITCPEIPDATSQTLEVLYRTEALQGHLGTLKNPVISTEFPEYTSSKIEVNSSSVNTVILYKLNEGEITLGDNEANMGDVYVRVVENTTTEPEVEEPPTT